MSDAALVLRARGGDELAFRRLVEACRPRIDFLVAKFFAPGIGGEDLHQTALLAVHEAVTGYQPGRASFTTYAHGVIERRVIDLVKGARRRKHSPLNDADSLHRPTNAESHQTLADTLPDRIGHGDPHIRLVQSEQIQDTLKAVRGLSELERDALRGVVNGRTYTEIAAESGSEVKSVDNALQRARRKLSEQLEPLVA